MADEHAATQREHTALHEAGHAVIGRVLGIRCGHATILADEDLAGHSLAAPPHEFLERWWHNLGRYYREEAAAFHARIMTYMAGAEAERVLLGACNGGDGNDLGEIAWMAPMGSGMTCSLSQFSPRAGGTVGLTYHVAAVAWAFVRVRPSHGPNQRICGPSIAA